MSSFLVLGGSSFSGNNTAASLTKTHKVVCLNRNINLANVFKNNLINYENYTEYEWNLNDSPELLERILREHNIDTVLNFAAQSMVGQSWEQPEDWYQANLVGFATTIRTLSRHPGLKKFIQFTTPEVYGSTHGWVEESFQFAPNTPYAISRAASDWHLKALHENFGFPAIFTRAANVFGEHQQLYRIVPRVILSAITGRKLPLQGGGKSIRSFIHIQDVSAALVRIIERGTPGESYHISTNELITIHELVATVANKMNVNFEDLVEIAPDRPGKDYAYQLDSRKIRSELRWKDEISLSDGLDRTIKWVLDNIDELKKLPLNYEHRK